MRSAYLVKARQRRNQAVGSNNAEEPAKNSQQMQGPSNTRKHNHTSPDPDPPMSVQDTMNSAEDPIFVEDPASNKPQKRNFLPIAMPRPDPPEDGPEMVDAEYEYRSICEAPDDIEFPSGSNLEGENHDDSLSAMSGLTGLNTLGTFTQHKIDKLSKVSQLQSRGEESRSRQLNRELTKRLHLQRRNVQKFSNPRNRVAHYHNKFATSQPKQPTRGAQMTPVARRVQIIPADYLGMPREMVIDAQDCLEMAINTQDYLEAELQKVPRSEEVLDDVESIVCNPIPRTAPEPKPRHGLPYEPTDYNGDEEDSVVDPWDRAITLNSKKKALEWSFLKRDPEECGGCGDWSDQIQGPPTPRKHLSDSVLGRDEAQEMDETQDCFETLQVPSLEEVLDDIEGTVFDPVPRSAPEPNSNGKTLERFFKRDPEECGDLDDQIQGPPTPRKRSSFSSFGRVRETLSPRGDVVLDITDIEDEDIEKNSWSGSDSNEHQTAADSRPVEQSVSSESTKSENLRRRAREAQSQQEHNDDNSSGTSLVSLDISPEPESEDDELVGELLADMDDDDEEEFTPNVTPDTDTNIECRDEEPERSQEEWSFAYFKSVANDLGSQLQSIDLSSKLESIQNITLIDDSGIDKMLGALEKGLKETSDKSPEKRAPYLSFLGGEFEKRACGIDRTTQGENDYDYVSSEQAPFQDEPTGLLQKRMQDNGVIRIHLAPIE
jgi:hypothetical protein